MMELTENLFKLLEITQNAAKNSPFHLLNDLKELNITTFNINKEEFKYLEGELEKNIDEINDNFASSNLFDDMGLFSYNLTKIQIDKNDYLFKIDYIANSGFENTINLRFKFTENKIDKIRELESEILALQKEVLADFTNMTKNREIRSFLLSISENIYEITYITELLSDFSEKQIHTLDIGTKVPKFFIDRPSWYMHFEDDCGSLHTLSIKFENNVVKDINYKIS